MFLSNESICQHFLTFTLCPESPHCPAFQGLTKVQFNHENKENVVSLPYSYPHARVLTLTQHVNVSPCPGCTQKQPITGSITTVVCK